MNLRARASRMPRCLRNPRGHRLRTIKPELEVGITLGAGQVHQLEVPEQVNAMIDRFLATAA